jgi:hypothetical protein
MTRTHFAFVAVAAIALTSCGRQTAAPAAPALDHTSCAVYRSFYEQLPVKERNAFRARSSPEMLVTHRIDDVAPIRFERGNGLLAPPGIGEPPPEEFAADTSSYWGQVRTKPAVRLSDCFPEEGPRFFEDSENLTEDVRQAGTDKVWRVSPVAISADGRRALILGSHWCGSLCGGTDYYLFDRAGSDWVLVGHHSLWIS